MSEVKTSRKLLVSEILRGDPCYVYSQRLRDRFTGEIEVTVELALSQADDWDWYWAASRLLTEEGYEKFLKIVDKGNEASDAELLPLRDASRAVHNRAREEYFRVLNDSEKGSNYQFTDAARREASKVYSEMTEVIDAAYEAARKITEARVDKVSAEAFASLYIGEEGTTQPTGYDKWYGRDGDYEDDYYEDDDNDY